MQTHQSDEQGLTMAPQALEAKKEEYYPGDQVTHPVHGVGRVKGFSEADIGGQKLKLLELYFDEARLALRVPVGKLEANKIRRVATREVMDTAIAVIGQRRRQSRAMWARKAQEFEAKINSGDPCVVAEVIRDLGHNADSPERSFSERQIYERALDRLASELAIADGTDKAAAAEKLTKIVTKVTAGNQKAAAEAKSAA